MKDKYDLVEVKADELPMPRTPAIYGLWQQLIQRFLNSDMISARVTSESADVKAQKRAYNGLLTAIRRNFSGENISVVWRHGDVYLLKGFGLEGTDK